MQYKIPIQIENEDPIVLWLSLRQLTIMMVWWGFAYVIFKSLVNSVGPQVALIFALPFALIGIIIALVRISEMTFLPYILNLIRLKLNAQSRKWSMWCDSYSDMEIGYITLNSTKTLVESNKSFQSVFDENTEIKDKILKL